MEKIKQAITLTQEAVAQIKVLLAEAPDERCVLKLGVKNAGCVGQAYSLDYIQKPEPLDEVIEDKGVVVAIEPKALMFLLGTEMDYKEDVLTSGFVFNNPNQIDACGCGESVQLKPSELILEK
jgi:iron-sulfur cluster assembly protein